MPPKSMQTEIETFYPENREAWRAWLMENGHTRKHIWLIYYKAKSGKPSLAYSDAVDEALCFGWIDSTSRPIDGDKYMQYFCPRKPNSVWSKINKKKVERLIREGRMTQAGMALVEKAKENGSWNILDSAEALEVPSDLEEALNAMEGAGLYFSALSRTDKRNLLQWLVLAKRPETRAKRIHEIASCAARQCKPGPYAGKKNAKS